MKMRLFESLRSPSISKIKDLYMILLAVCIALAVGALFLLLIDASPLDVYSAMLENAIGNYDSVLRRAMALMLTGLAVAIPFRTGMINMGGEGQIAAGAIAAAVIGSMDLGLPTGIHALVSLGVAVLVGILLAGLPALLYVKRGVNEVVVTIMLNSILSYIITWLVMNPFRGSEFSPSTAKVLESARIPGFGEDIDFSWGLIISLLVCFLAWFFLERTPRGLELKSVGLSPLTARYQGINTKTMSLLSMFLGGAFAALGGALEVLGGAFSYTDGNFLHYGFDGVAIAFMARNNPLGIIGSSIFISAIRIGSLAISRKTGISTYFVTVVQGLMITLLVVPSFTEVIVNSVKHAFTRRKKS